MDISYKGGLKMVNFYTVGTVPTPVNKQSNKQKCLHTLEDIACGRTQRKPLSQDALEAAIEFSEKLTGRKMSEEEKENLKSLPIIKARERLAQLVGPELAEMVYPKTTSLDKLL